MYPNSVRNLISSLKDLPGIGEKSAERLAFPRRTPSAAACVAVGVPGWVMIFLYSYFKMVQAGGTSVGFQLLDQETTRLQHADTNGRLYDHTDDRP